MSHTDLAFLVSFLTTNLLIGGLIIWKDSKRKCMCSKCKPIKSI